MAFTKITKLMTVIASLGTKPQDRPLTTEQFKAKFDEEAESIKGTFNTLIDDMLATTNGKGASQIGLEDSAGRYTATNTETALAEIAGAGRKTETVKGLADLISNLAGSGRTTETVKGLADLIRDGWIPVADSWIYASAVTITVPSGAAAKYSKGDRIKLTQTTVKYFAIVGVADTVLTITGGSDYTLTNAAISSVSVSHMPTPAGFPAYFNYAPIVTVSGGTAPTYTSTMARFMVNQDLVDVVIELTNTTGGTAGASTNPISIVLPILSLSSVSSLIGSGVTYEESGTMGACFCRYDGAGGFYAHSAAFATITGADQSSANRYLRYKLRYFY